MKFNFKIKKWHIILIVVIGFIVFILVGAYKKAQTRKALQNYTPTNEAEIEKPDITYEDLPSDIEIDDIPSSNDGVKVENHKYESVDDFISKNKPVENEFKSLSIGVGDDKVSPAVVASDIDKYRKYSLVQVADVQVSGFVPKELYGQTLAKVDVQVEGNYNSQSIFFACTDTLELSNQLDLYKRINIVGNASDMFVTDIRLEDGTVYYNALVVPGVFSRIF